MELLINAVELVALAVGIVKVNIGFAVTVDAPAHAKFSHLLHFIHGSYFTMTALALYLTGTDVL